MNGRVKLILMASLMSTATQGFAQTGDTSGTRAQIGRLNDANYPRLERLYRDIHAHAEIAFQETRTAQILASEMRRIGFDVMEKVGGTGVVALYRNGSGPTVMVRTELDGLPMEEKTGLPYASRNQQAVDGKMGLTAHACGHDAHMAWWLGTAYALVAMKDHWSGTLMFVAQPAEETVSGAKAMIADGLFTRFPKPDFAFAAHVSPEPAGSVRVKEGTATSAQDAVDIHFKGRGAHGSMPSASIDPIVIGAHFVTDVQTVISRQKDANQFGVITVGSFQAGSVANIIPDSADLKLTLRSFTPEVRRLLLDGVTRTANASAAMAGAPEPVVKVAYGTAAVRNDTALVHRAAERLRQVLGESVRLVPEYVAASPASEDFSEFVDAGIPSVYYFVGGNDQKVIDDYKARGVPLPINHSPYYTPSPEPAIRSGIEVLTLSVLMVAQGRKQ